MKFKPSLAAEEFITDIHQRVGARNKAVLGRSALFLALGEGVPPEFKSLDSQGKDLDDETVIGDELHDVVRAALNHRMGKELDETGYRQAFRLHFEYGCYRLKEIWADCGNDQVKFVTELLKLAGDLKPGAGPGKPVFTLPIVETEVKLKVLVDAPAWSLNGLGTNNGLLVISGQPGTGKSQLALDLLAQLANSGVRFVFFDMKGELEDDPNNPQQRQNRTQFLRGDWSTARPAHPDLCRSIRCSVIRIQPQNAQVAYEIASLIRCFAPQLGAKQERNIADAYEHLASPDFRSLEQELVNSGADGVDLAIIQKIERLHLFANADKAVSAEEWLNGSLVVDFKEFSNDTETKALAVALILNFLIKKLSQSLGVKNSIQPIKMVLFVDEAHLLLPKESKAGLLQSLARQGRSWGFPVWLASQDADKFVTDWGERN